ncbi:MAG: S41 family peptidase [Bacteroidetes bacterium]|nr:MAG: S41 family peptidase [Bacteroidota bacterium]
MQQSGNKPISIALPLIIAGAIALGMWLGYALRARTAPMNNVFVNTQKTALQEAVDIIQKRYVDQLPADSLNEMLVQSWLNKLDPHSVYIPAVDVKDVNASLEANYSGLGIEFQIWNDTLTITSVLPNGPAALAKLQPGDQLITANDTTNLVKLKIPQYRRILRGAPGSTIALKLRRNNEIIKSVVTRNAVATPSVEGGFFLQPAVGYIRIVKFGESTYEEFMPKLDKLVKQGMKKLVIDVRGNGGGFMNEAVDIADEFLDGNKLIVYTQGHATGKINYLCKRTGLFEQGELVLLADETSASASEVLAGALQDWNRATIIGRRTFGKGLVQQQYNLSDGSALRLTVARYYTPLGRNIQKPYADGKSAYEADLIHRWQDGEMVLADTTKPKGKAYRTPNGKLVYDGGGVTPDVFVPLDTATQSKNVQTLFAKGLLYKAAFTLVGQKNITPETAQLALENELKLASIPNNFSTNQWQFITQRIVAIHAKINKGEDAYLQELSKTDDAIKQALLPLK